MQQIIAVNDQALVSSAGIVTYWSIHDSIGYDAVCAQLKAAGLDDGALPGRMSASKCLMLALEDAYVTARGATKVMALKGQSSKIGLYQHTGGSGESNYRCLWAVSADDKGVITYHDMAAAHDLIDEDMVSDGFAKVWGKLLPSDIGSWLAKLVRSPLINGLSLRDHGGIYFVPPNTRDMWNKIVAAIPNVKLFRIPALNGPDAVAAVVSALGEEAQQLAHDLLEIKRKPQQEDVKGKGGVRKSTIERMEKEAANGIEKIKLYEQVLGQKLDALRTQLTNASVEKTTADILSY
jgi:hypothetical protein